MKHMDIFDAVRNYEIAILRFTSRKDIYTVLDLRLEALEMLDSYDCENQISNDLYIFLKHRICRAARATGLL